MSVTLAHEPLVVPLTRLENGTYRITGTRISLEQVIEYFQDGDTPEDIVSALDSLRLADVYAIISYYLTHQAEVNEYVRAQNEEGDRIQKMIEAEQPWRAGLRERLLARRAKMERNGDAPGQ